MQTTFLDEMRIWAICFALQSHKRNVGDSRYNEVTDFFELNVDINL